MQNDEKQQTVASPIKPVVMLPWVAIDSAEDIDCDHEVLLWDGCDWHLDCVEYDDDQGVSFFANGTTEVTHYMVITQPE